MFIFLVGTTDHFQRNLCSKWFLIKKTIVMHIAISYTFLHHELNCLLDEFIKALMKFYGGNDVMVRRLDETFDAKIS